MSDFDQIRMVLARYVRGADQRNGALLAQQFAEDGVVEIRARHGSEMATVGELKGRDQISDAVTNMMAAHPEGGWSHHTTFDHIIDITGDQAEMDAQFIMYRTQATPEPKGGWPAGTVGVQGTIEPLEAGYYRPSLRRIDGRWLITHLRIDHDLSFAVPGA